jgi:hypothetical protein
MAGFMVRIGERAHSTLRALALRDHQPMSAVLDRALEAYRRQRMLEDLNAAYGRLRQDAAEWTEVEAERRLWDGTLSDGLEAGESWRVAEGCPPSGQEP